ncbi:tetratricopeptide repeat protein [Allocoleopsis sp.]|uniref:tetratricopeptide repeat protein n=1 Tax=Allocoleopsis sp. TaxID=3088169 RepID=UPI002FCF5B80
MSKVKQVIQGIERWANLIMLIITVIGLIYTMLSFYYGSVNVTNFDGSVKVTNFEEANLCNGFLVNDPLSHLLTNTSLSNKEKDYLESKINCYRDAIQNNRNHAEAYTNIGEAERRLGNMEAALKAHHKALELKPDLPEAKIGLALIEQGRGKKVAANQAIQGVLAVHPRNAIAHFYQGTILYAQNQLKDAAVAWQKAKELDPNLPKPVRTWKLPNIKHVLGWQKNEPSV